MSIRPTARPVKTAAARRRRPPVAAGPHKSDNPAPKTPDDADLDRLAGETLLWWGRVGGFLNDLYDTLDDLLREVQRPGSVAAAIFTYGALRDCQMNVSNTHCEWLGVRLRLTARLPARPPAGLLKGR